MVPLLVNAALGIWLMAAPALLGCSGASRANDRIAGPIAAASALIALHEVARSLRWVNLALGVWMLVAPWVLGYDLVPFLHGCVIGALLVGCSLACRATRQRVGGGWSCLWQTTLAPAGAMENRHSPSIKGV